MKKPRTLNEVGRNLGKAVKSFAKIVEDLFFSYFRECDFTTSNNPYEWAYDGKTYIVRTKRIGNDTKVWTASSKNLLENKRK
jgi:Tfp pilus assembly ATPase PilU